MTNQKRPSANSALYIVDRDCAASHASTNYPDEFGHRYLILENLNSYENGIWYWLSPWRNTHKPKIFASISIVFSGDMFLIRGDVRKTVRRFRMRSPNVPRVMMWKSSRLYGAIIYGVLKGIRYNWYYRSWWQNQNRNMLSSNELEKNEFTTRCSDQQCSRIAPHLIPSFWGKTAETYRSHGCRAGLF